MKPPFVLLLTALSIWLGLLFGSQLAPQSESVIPVETEATSGQLKSIGHPSFMSPHASPIVVHGKHVFVVNTPADTVDLINIETREVTHRIDVGVDPVSLAVRPDGNEVWVSNHISDSVSVIDTRKDSPTFLQVIETIQDFDQKTKSTRFDEPVGIAFANNEKAYVALSSENQIAVIDVATRTVSKRLKIRSQDPRQIFVREGLLYVIPFESNNKTQLSGGNKDNIDGDLVTFDAWNHSIVNNNVLSIGHAVDIVKHPDVPDRDLFVFDTRNDKLVRSVNTLGTLLYGMTVNSAGEVFIAQTDARNDINGRAGTKKHGLKELQNRAFLNRVTRVKFAHHSDDEEYKQASDAKVDFFDLEPLPPQAPRREDALATPFAITLDDDEKHLFVTAAGSNKLVALNAETGETLSRVEVGSVPRGIAIDASGQKNAWVFNAVDNSVSLIDISEPQELALLQTVELEDPTDAMIKRGRKVFNSASGSTTGTFSCASCHPDGHTDQLLWVLKTPVVTGGKQIMPRSTMPIRGLRETAPFHWDGIPGDPYGGINSASLHRNISPNSDKGSPESSVRHLIDGAQASTMSMVGSEGQNDESKAGLLSGKERDELAKFLLSVPYPPAQRRPYTNELTNRARKGFELFHISGDKDPTKINSNVCGDCHRMPNWVSTNTPGTGMDAPTWRGAYDRWLILPQGRLNIVEFDFFKQVAEQGLDERKIWQFSWAGRRRFDPVWDMVLEGSTGFSGTFARQVTLNRQTAEANLTLDLMDAMETAAKEESLVIQVSGGWITQQKFSPVKLQFAPVCEEYIDVEEPGESGLTQRELLSLANAGKFIGTLTAHLTGTFDDHPQPVLWTQGPIEQQRGHQEFPWLHKDQKSMIVSGRHIDPDAKIVVDGRRVKGSLLVDGETVRIELENLPAIGLHTLQVHNPVGLFSNDFLFHVAEDAKTATITRREIERDRTDNRVALIQAVSKGDADEVKLLLDRSARVNARHPEDGGTALSAAALHGHLKIAQLLLEHGANPSRSNRDGNTPLHVAAFLCRFDLVDLLLEHGASAAIKNKRQETPLDVVSGEWSMSLASFYQSIADSSGFKIDLDQIRIDRSRMAEQLGNAQKKTNKK